MKLIALHRIWGKAPHNAFTDLLYHQDRWWCVFREGQSHVSPDGVLRMITSTDGETWESAACLTSATEDLRDAKLTVTPDGHFMLLGAGALHSPQAYSYQSYAWFSSDGRTWSSPVPVVDPDYWLWRVTWHKSICYGIGYACGQRRNIRLYYSQDGKRFETLVENLYDQGYPNETSLVFLPDDSAICLLRRDPLEGDKTFPEGLLGVANPPYTRWTWAGVGRQIGGPHLLHLSDGRLLAAVRLYDEQVRTSLCWVDRLTARLEECLPLPSGGDTSYPGLIWQAGLLWVSYYSSHEDKTAIYLAKVKIDPPQDDSPVFK